MAVGSVTAAFAVVSAGVFASLSKGCSWSIWREASTSSSQGLFDRGEITISKCESFSESVEWSGESEEDGVWHMPPGESEEDAVWHMPPVESEEDAVWHIPPVESEEDAVWHMPPGESEEDAVWHMPPVESEEDAVWHMPPVWSEKDSA